MVLGDEIISLFDNPNNHKNDATEYRVDDEFVDCYSIGIDIDITKSIRIETYLIGDSIQ